MKQINNLVDSSLTFWLIINRLTEGDFSWESKFLHEKCERKTYFRDATITLCNRWEQQSRAAPTFTFWYVVVTGEIKNITHFHCSAGRDSHLDNTGRFSAGEIIATHWALTALLAPSCNLSGAVGNSTRLSRTLWIYIVEKVVKSREIVKPHQLVEQISKINNKNGWAQLNFFYP